MVPGRSRRWLGRLLADVRPLRESPAFRRLWAGSLLSSTGGAMTRFALVLQVYQLTHSAAAVGALGLAQVTPAVLIGLPGGSVSDAADRRRLVLITSGCLAVVSAAFTAQAYAGLRWLWLLYALAAVQAVFQAVDGPARRTFMPRLLPREQVPAGTALNLASFHLCYLAGPVLAGFVTAAAGLKVCYLADAVSFAAALYGVARLPAMPPGGGHSRPGPRATLEGLRFIRRSQVLAGAFLADLGATVLGMPLALFPALNAAHFGGGARSLGLLSGAVAAGGMLGSTLSGPAARVSRQGRAMLIMIVIWGASIAGFGLARTLWLALLLLAAAGAADATSVVFRGTIVQLATPDRLRGRVMSADYVVGLGGPQLGNAESGLLASVTSPVISAVSGGAAAAAGAAVIGFALPAFRRCRIAAVGTPAPVGIEDGSAD